jgi:hypothetical protein
MRILCPSRSPALGAAVAALLLPAGLAAAPPPKPLVIWPGYVFELPPDHCIDLSKGPDFDLLYVRARRSSREAVLTGIYAGFAPSFEPECGKPTRRSWKANGLSFESVRGAEGCAEFLVEDPTNRDRGKLHLWFGPAAKNHPQLAERLLGSIRPAAMPVKDVSDLPQCGE